MKGVVNIEFIFSVFIFTVTIIFVLISLASSLAPLHKDAVTDSVRSKVYQMSELLLFDEGDPKNWQAIPSINSINRIGLSTGEKYSISQGKITKLQALCNTNYADVVKRFFGDESLRLEIEITNSAGLEILDCGVVGNPQFSIKRTAFIDSTKEIVEINIAVKK